MSWGRDVYSRLLHGGRITLPSAFAITFISTILGVVIGAMSGYVGGLWDEIAMRSGELVLAFPALLVVMTVLTEFGPSARNAVLVVAVVSWPNAARIARAGVIHAKQQPYVDAARCLGASPLRIIMRTILPNALSSILVFASLDLSTAVLIFTGLSFLGLGADPATPEWGRMVALGVDFFGQWWIWLFPSLAIASMSVACNLIGDGFRDAFDPLA